VTIGLLHPGEMGAAVGAALVASGHDVVWVSDGRSDETRARAEQAGLVDAGTLPELAWRSDVVISLCPPEFAVGVAASLRATGFTGTYVDANAVSPATVARIAPTVDGGVIGPPPRVAGTTRLYLSGADADAIASLFAGTVLDARVVDDRVGSASALKMSYAAYTKGISALLLALRETARAHDVDDALLAEWALSQPQLAGLCELAEANAAPKAWRWIAEMEEIAATFAAAGQPDGFHRAAAEVYRAVAAERAR
jgi:3-hydroxyisobutyrate dehydrogenase-like beta-hydroxyacid dehydrogenase